MSEVDIYTLKRGILTRDVHLASTGFSRKAGAKISSTEVPSNIWDLWVKDGVVRAGRITVLRKKDRKRLKDKG